jgi:UDP-galactopyranose mutase
MKRFLVVGAGFSGAVVARELAEKGHLVDVIECRDHIGGNAYDYTNEIGIRIHKYGPHIFHTSNVKVVDWLSRFTGWLEYKHKVKALLSDGRYVTLPVNRETASIVGINNIVEVFYRPYTKKMWGIDLEELDPTVLARIPVRSDLNEYYFPDDTFQALPDEGYTKMFERILDHPRIHVRLNSKFVRGMEDGYAHTFNSMAIDEYFDYRYERLPYRSIRFHTYTIAMPTVLPVSTVNFTHTAPYTRVTEWKKFPGHGGVPGLTTLTVEEPCDYIENNFERYYPVKDSGGRNAQTYLRYRSATPSNITFIGRCGQYAYLDMHQAVSSALSVARKFLANFSE